MSARLPADRGLLHFLVCRDCFCPRRPADGTAL